MGKILYIIGGSSTALEMRETAELYYSDLYSSIINVIGDNEDEPSDIDFITDADFMRKVESKQSFCYILGFTIKKLRKKYLNLLDSNIYQQVSIIHQQAYISKTAVIGEGSYIAANAIVSTNAQIGKRSIINYQCMIGHDCSIGDDCIFNPGAKISGRVKIGEKCLIGSNSFIYQGTTIGQNSIIDALTYVKSNIDENSICSSRISNNNLVCKNLFNK